MAEAAENQAANTEIGSLQHLVPQFGFSEQNVPAMQLLLAVFGGFATSLVGLFMGLRFEPNFLFGPFRS